MKWPTVDELTQELLSLYRSLADYNAEDDVDIRLQVTDGGWTVNWGPSDFDVDHSGYWGASSLPSYGFDADQAKEVARHLINEAHEACLEDVEFE